MLKNFRLISVNAWDKATLALAQGTEDPAQPLSHSQRYNNSRVFRSTAPGTLVINFNFSKFMHLSGLAFWRHNLTSDARVRLELFGDENQTGPNLHDSGDLEVIAPKTLGDLDFGKEPLGATVFADWSKSASAFWFENVTCKSGRLTITDTANPEGFLEIGRIYLGDTFSPSVNVDLGHSLKWDTQGDALQTAGGTYHTLESAANRVLKFNLSHLSEEDRAKFSDLSRVLLNHKDFFVSLRPLAGGNTTRDYAFAAKFSETPEVTARPGRYETYCIIREV